MSTTTRRIDFDQLAQHPEYRGYGYIGERDHLTDFERSVADEAVNRLFRDARPEFLFEWANSKNGRWFAEEAIVAEEGMSLDANVAKLIERARMEGTI